MRVSGYINMGEHYSMNQQSNITWYLDSEAIVEDANEDGTHTRAQHQPWRVYWPPKCEKMMQTWLNSEFPEVLSWRFDRHLPFDRPWRTWARSGRALQEQAGKLTYRPISEISGKFPIPRWIRGSNYPPSLQKIRPSTNCVD